MIWMRKQRGLGEGDLGAKGCNISLSDIIESASVSGLLNIPCTDHDLEDNSERAQSCPTLCNPTDWSPLDSFHGILQARILECMAMPSSRESSQTRDQTCVCFGRQVLCLQLVPLGEGQKGLNINIKFQMQLVRGKDYNTNS